MTTVVAEDKGGLFTISGRQWLILLMVQLANMLFGMTITIANLVLPQMRGNLSATQDEISWVITLNLVATAVATGAAEMGLTFTSELKPNPGVKVAGTLPAVIQLPTIYAVALVPMSGSADAAREFVKVLSGAEGRAAIERAGLEPLNPGR